MCKAPQPVYFYPEHQNGVWCSVDGQPEFFKTRVELYMFACDEGRDVIEVTPENESDLRTAGAFTGGSHE